jgi:methyltransferase
MSTQAWYTLGLAMLALERGFELWLSRCNARALGERGGVEVGQRQFQWMTVLHSGFFAGCLLEVWLAGASFPSSIALPALFAAVLAQGLRYWAIASLGVHWNVRVVVLPGSSVIRAGPYRWIRHPNYLAVGLEGLAVPLIHGALLTAIGFTLLNAWLLAGRVRLEERALEQHCGYGGTFGATPRWLPGWRIPGWRVAGRSRRRPKVRLGRLEP